MTSSNNPTIALRFAQDEDALVVRRLAALDDARPLHGEVLIAFVDDVAVAAASLNDGRVVANPFRRTADAVTLLSMRVAQLSERPARRRLPRLRAA